MLKKRTHFLPDTSTPRSRLDLPAFLLSIVLSLTTITSFLFILYLILNSLSLPEVRFSNSTGKCVEVRPPSAGDCDNLPEKYVLVWVY